MGAIPKPPWEVADTTVDVVRDFQRGTVTILVPCGCMSTMSDEQILELMDFCAILAKRLEEATGWKVRW
jgi:hypothetical protein